MSRLRQVERMVRAQAWLTQEEFDELDKQKGLLSRSIWMRQAIRKELLRDGGLTNQNE